MLVLVRSYAYCPTCEISLSLSSERVASSQFYYRAIFIQLAPGILDRSRCLHECMYYERPKITVTLAYAYAYVMYISDLCEYHSRQNGVHQHNGLNSDQKHRIFISEQMRLNLLIDELYNHNWRNLPRYFERSPVAFEWLHRLSWCFHSLNAAKWKCS